MKRFLMILALGGIVISGCGDDDGDDDDTPDTGTPRADAGPDSSVDAGGMDARAPDSGTDSGVTAKVTNVGAACTTATAATACMPAGATCATTTGIGIPAPGGGFCTATCDNSNQCGTTGACPWGDLLNSIAGSAVYSGFGDAGVPRALLDTTKQCLLKCNMTGGQSNCPTGWRCSNLKTEQTSLAAAETMAGVTAVSTPVCIPNAGIIPGTGTPDGGTDAGPRDSGVADASGIDSGR